MTAKKRITVVGLGSGDASQLTLGIVQLLLAAGQRAKKEGSINVYVRTREHPAVSLLEQSNVPYASFDALYEASDTFEDVYEQMAQRLLAAAKGEERVPVESQLNVTNVSMETWLGTQPFEAGHVIYAVPGHPMVAEKTVQLLRERCATEQIELNVLGGESFLDQAFVRLGFDPIEGFQLLDATALSARQLNPLLHTVVGQVYDRFTASDVKLTLMELYPDDYPVVVGHALGVSGVEKIVHVPLYELDRLDGYGNLSLIFVPATKDDSVLSRTFGRLHEIVSILRSPNGCPWDREQTHQSIRKNLIEEAYEVIETIDDEDVDHMREELGDLMLQVMLHAQMEEEEGSFTVFDVIEELNEKLLRRHPHVFGERKADSAEAALGHWQKMKDEEKRRKGIKLEEQSVLDGVPRDLPGLMKAYKLQKKAAKVGFDWSGADEVYPVIESELQEVKEAVAEGDAAHLREELGDLLFAVVNLSRFLQVEPEEAIAVANKKFTTRFHYIEERLRLKGQAIGKTELAEMELLWQEAKKVEK